MRKTTRDHRHDIGVLIGIAREDSGDSQTKAAAQVGTSQTTWNHWEKSISLPSPEQMDAIVRVYFANEVSRMKARYEATAKDWENTKPPVPTRSYDTPKGKKGDPHQRK